MQKNKKVLGVLSTAAIASLFTAALSTTVSAAVDGIVINDAESGKNVEFNKAELQESLRQVMRGSEDGTALWESFEEYAQKEGNKIVSYHDDATGYVAAEDVLNAVRDAMREGSEFVLDTFTEAAEGEETLENLATAEVDEDGVVVVEDKEEEVVDADFEVDEVKAIGANKVEVKLKEAVEAVSAGNFEITEKNESEALEITDATVDGKYVVLTVEGLKNGRGYTLTANEVSKNFTAVKEEKSAPDVDEVECTDYGVVTVTFDTILDEESAEDVSNYSVNKGVEVVEAKLNSNRKSVDLTITGWDKGHSYNVTVENVENVDGVAMKSKSRSRSFRANEFRSEPKVENVKTFNSRNNLKVKVDFKSKFELDEESVEDISNYSIKEGLEIIDAEYTYDSDEKDNYVILTTQEQESGKRYTLSVSGIQDTSAKPNVMTRVYTDKFNGAHEDKKAPKLDDVEAISANKIEVQFNDDNALDEGSVLNSSNYTFDKDLDVLNVEWYDEDADRYEKDGQRVVITTSEQDEHSYKLTVDGVQDEFGNAVDNEYERFNSGENVENPPYIDSIVAKSNGKAIEIKFDNGNNKSKLTLDSSALDPTNYAIYDGDDLVSAALSVDWTDDNDGDARQKVEIKVPTLDNNKSYTVKIDSVSDVLGNSIQDLEVKVVVPMDENDSEAPTIEDMDAISESEVEVQFSEAVNVEAGKAQIKLQKLDENDKLTGDEVILTAQYTYGDDDENVLFTVTKGSISDSDAEYSVIDVTGITDKNNNLLTEFDYELDGNDNKVEAPVFDYGEVLAPNKLMLVFTKPVQPTKENLDSYIQIKNVKIDEIYHDDTDTVEDYSTLYVKLKDVLDEDKEYTAELNNVVDYAGKKVSEADDLDVDDHKYVFDGYDEDEDGPVLDRINVVHQNKIELEFDEDLDEGRIGKYKIEDEDEDNVTIKRMYVDDNVVTLVLDDKVEYSEEYTLECTTAPRDLFGNPAEKDDIDREFYGTDKIVKDRITGISQDSAFGFSVNLMDGDIKEDTADIDVKVTIKDTTPQSIKVSYDSEDDVFSTTNELNGKVESLYKLPLLADAQYEITVDTEDGDELSKTFDGYVSDDLNTYVQQNDKKTAYEIGYADMLKGDHVVIYDLTNEKVTLFGSNKTGFEVKEDNQGVEAELEKGKKYLIVVYRGEVPTTEKPDVIYNAVSAKVETIEAE
jgi:hypothetical protein